MNSSNRPDDLELEVTRVGEGISQQFLTEISRTVGLPVDVCSALLKSGWELELNLGEPHKWIQTVPKLFTRQTKEWNDKSKAV